MELDTLHTWDPPAMDQSSWAEMVDSLLQDPDPLSGSACPDAQSGLSVEDADLLGLLMNEIGELGSGEDVDSAEWWSNNLPLDHSQLPDLSDTLALPEQESLPALCSEVSSFDNLDLNSSGDGFHGVSSPESCSIAKKDSTPPSNSDEEAGIVSYLSHTPIPTSCYELKASSPDSGSYSSDVGAIGNSCDNFAGESQKRVSDTVGAIDEDAKRESRLMRNRESATQSRLRKKSYVKELEAKSRMMESQINMLQQTVAFTSAQNAALREELARVKSLKGNGPKSGAMEPAALPSDSLPSESPSHRSSPCLLVKWELVACLCHVLLLTLLRAPHLRPATSGESTPSKARSERRDIYDFSLAKQRLGVWQARHRVVIFPVVEGSAIAHPIVGRKGHARLSDVVALLRMGVWPSSAMDLARVLPLRQRSSGLCTEIEVEI